MDFQDSFRVLTLDERIHDGVGDGVYGTVFAVGGAAIKVFKRWPQLPPRLTETGRRLVFEAQCEAYRVAAKDPLLARHVPVFLGPRMLNGVIDANGVNISHRYFLECAYMMQRVSGPQSDWASARRQGGLDHLEPVGARFSEAGIDASDASVFNAEDPENFKVIDFEIRNYVWERIL